MDTNAPKSLSLQKYKNFDVKSDYIKFVTWFLTEKNAQLDATQRYNTFYDSLPDAWQFEFYKNNTSSQRTFDSLLVFAQAKVIKDLVSVDLIEKIEQFYSSSWPPSKDLRKCLDEVVDLAKVISGSEFNVLICVKMVTLLNEDAKTSCGNNFSDPQIMASEFWPEIIKFLEKGGQSDCRVSLDRGFNVISQVIGDVEEIKPPLVNEIVEAHYSHASPNLNTDQVGLEEELPTMQSSFIQSFDEHCAKRNEGPRQNTRFNSNNFKNEKYNDKPFKSPSKQSHGGMENLNTLYSFPHNNRSLPNSRKDRPKPFPNNNPSNVPNSYYSQKRFDTKATFGSFPNQHNVIFTKANERNLMSKEIFDTFPKMIRDSLNANQILSFNTCNGMKHKSVGRIKLSISIENTLIKNRPLIFHVLNAGIDIMIGNEAQTDFFINALKFQTPSISKDVHASNKTLFLFEELSDGGNRDLL